MKRSFFLLVLLSLLIAVPSYAGKLSLKVTGMHCSGCEMKFKSAASEIKGIQEVVSVSSATGQAEITYDEKLITPEQIVNELASRSGFTVSASTPTGVSTVEGKPSGCCAPGQKNPSCKEGDKAKSCKKHNKQPVN